jgi:hypothetical protein
MTQKIHILRRRNRYSFFYLTPVAAVLLILTACASAPMAPTAELRAAEQAIETAEQTRITSPELNEARKKLTSAQSAVREEKMVVALRLAQQSRVDAELATANAGTARAKAVNDEMKDSTRSLKQEMQRNEGAQ